MRKYFMLPIIFTIILSMVYLITCGSKSMKKAKELIQVGMYDEAIPLLEMEVKEHPKNAEAHFLLGKAYLHTDEEDNARASFERAIITDTKFSSKVTEEYKGYGLALLKEERLEQAKEMFDQAVNFDAYARDAIAEILIQHGKEIAESDIEGSKWCFKEALNYSKDYKENIGSLCLSLADNFLDQDKVDESISFAKLAKGVLRKEFKKEAESYLVKLQETAPPIKAIGDIRPPRLIKRVWPVYPEEARERKIGGGVTLEVTTDIYGKVQKVKVLRSIPLLDHAAIDAVRQWEYEPKLVNGIPRAICFNIIVPFIMLYINRVGVMYINQDHITEESLQMKIDEAFFNARIRVFKGEERRLYLRADQDTPYSKIVDLIDILKEAGVEDVGITFARKILNVKLPETTADSSVVPWKQDQLVAPVEIPEEIQNFIFITLHKYKTVDINQEFLEFNLLNSRLKSIYKEYQNIPVFIRAEARIPFKHIIELIDIVKEAGFDTIGIIPVYFIEE